MSGTGRPVDNITKLKESIRQIINTTGANQSARGIKNILALCDDEETQNRSKFLKAIQREINEVSTRSADGFLGFGRRTPETTRAYQKIEKIITTLTAEKAAAAPAAQPPAAGGAGGPSSSVPTTPSAVPGPAAPPSPMPAAASASETTQMTKETPIVRAVIQKMDEIGKTQEPADRVIKELSEKYPIKDIFEAYQTQRFLFHRGRNSTRFDTYFKEHIKSHPEIKDEFLVILQKIERQADSTVNFYIKDLMGRLFENTVNSATAPKTLLADGLAPSIPPAPSVPGPAAPQPAGGAGGPSSADSDKTIRIALQIGWRQSGKPVSIEMRESNTIADLRQALKDIGYLKVDIIVRRDGKNSGETLAPDNETTNSEKIGNFDWLCFTARIINNTKNANLPAAGGADRPPAAATSSLAFAPGSPSTPAPGPEQPTPGK